jgi:hypothetical protein
MNVFAATAIGNGNAPVGRPNDGLLPLGGTARSAKGVHA